jgi:pimeloyl-ACP methyl ester carboxylesterase
MADSQGEQATVKVPAGGVVLEGTLTLPTGARGVVVFAHGSGSSRHSPRNGYVARVLNEPSSPSGPAWSRSEGASSPSERGSSPSGRGSSPSGGSGLATLLVDLLTPQEEAIDEYTRHLRFDIGLLAVRLVDAIDWLASQPATRDRPVGLFGSSTGAGAALVAAAERPGRVSCVVSRGGRPDLAGPSLPRVRAPVLLIVGGNDAPVIDLNRDAMAGLETTVELTIVPGATHLFEEPGALEQVAALARAWFHRFLG